MWDNTIGFAVGEAAKDRDAPDTLWQYDQGEWQTMDIPTEAKLLAVQMVSPTEAWTVGEYGTILHYLDGEWQDETFIDTTNRFDAFSTIQMFSSTSGWLLGRPGLFHYQNGQWIEVDRPASFSAMYMLSETEGWFDGKGKFVDGELEMNSYIWHYKDGTWTPIEKPLQHHEFRAIHMLNEDEGWMVGDAILHYTN